MRFYLRYPHYCTLVDAGAKMINVFGTPFLPVFIKIIKKIYQQVLLDFIRDKWKGNKTLYFFNLSFYWDPA